YTSKCGTKDLCTASISSQPPDAADAVCREMHPIQSCDEVAEILMIFQFDVDNDLEEPLVCRIQRVLRAAAAVYTVDGLNGFVVMSGW
ncbi:MAG: hypothetical protein M3H12_00355, partial [Chromatiales bacterium]